MDLKKVLEQLRAERADLDAAILSLERLQKEGRPRRGRPPKALAQLKSQVRRPPEPPDAGRKAESESS